ncbi:MAG: sirohydrochlorin chelatase [Acidiferrobacterales bacterium]
MKALLIVAHGSRREASNQEVRELSRRLAELQNEFDFVDSAFLEIAEPSIPAGLERCIEQGAQEVVVLPHFLAAGRHVIEDIPAELASIETRYPHVSFRITPHLGASGLMLNAMLDLAQLTRSR